jgi:redox-sensitive bicupin YhaK (pirin superfamily)
MSIEVRPPDGRAVTLAEGHTTLHSFSFGSHYDPANLRFGAIVAHNEELLPAGTGYPDHPHSDLEIVTLVISGALQHRDSSGHDGVVRPGQVQRISAGSGIVHSETADIETRFIQVWVRPDESGLVPSYALEGFEPRAGQLLCVAGDGGVVGLASAGTSMHVGQADQGTGMVLPDAANLHVFVATGSVTIGERLLVAGAAGRLTDQGGRAATVAADGTELIVWAFDR